jgi:hypothetical protein
MIHLKKLLVSCFIISLLIFGIAATTPPDPPKRNLKVLPKNISHEDRDKVMDGFKAALGVKCNFCHVPPKDTSIHHLDFASDEKPEKNIARKMMKMTEKINKKFFSYATNEKGEAENPITCVTCHRGNPHPEGPMQHKE